MVLEYLFLEKDKRKEVEEYKYSHKVKNHGKVTRNISPTVYFTEFNGTDHWAVKYEIEGRTEECAKHLSNINDYIIYNFSALVLRNDSSSYFNEKLFPLVNEFERLLRCFLFLKSIYCDDDKVSRFVTDMEKLDFGRIYEFLFVDVDFCNNARKATKDNHSKIDLMEHLKNLPDNTYWDTLFGNDRLMEVKTNFWKIRGYRNDVMHAHNINYHTFSEARNIFQAANASLEGEINDLIEFPEKPKDSEMFVQSSLDRLHELFLNIEAVNHQIQDNGIFDKIREGYNTIQKLSSLSITPEAKQIIDIIIKLSSGNNKSDENGEEEI